MGCQRSDWRGGNSGNGSSPRSPAFLVFGEGCKEPVALVARFGPSLIPGTGAQKQELQISWYREQTADHRHRFADRQLQQIAPRSEEHTSELQSLRHLVCRLLLENN